MEADAQRAAAQEAALLQELEGERATSALLTERVKSLEQQAVEALRKGDKERDALRARAAKLERAGEEDAMRIAMLENRLEASGEPPTAAPPGAFTMAEPSEADAARVEALAGKVERQLAAQLQ